MTSSSTERVLRGPAARAVTAVPLDMPLARSSGLPEELVAEARAVAQAEGYAAGWTQGRRDAAEQARAQAEATAAAERAAAADRAAAAVRALDALARAVSALEQRTAPALDELDDVLADAALRLAEAIVGRELRTAEEPGRDAVRRALSQLPGNRPVTVTLHPDDLAELVPVTGHEAEIDGRFVRLVADSDLERGDALAECDATRVDARIAAALERARAVLQ